MSEATRIAEQLENAFQGGAWHGPALLELLADVDAKTAATRPLPNAHSIWELVLHIAAWDDAVNRRIVFRKPVQLKARKNFPPVVDKSPAGWKKTIAYLQEKHMDLLKTVRGLSDARLRERVPGKRYNIGFMLHGVAQHELYHAGQIALLKKAGL